MTASETALRAHIGALCGDIGERAVGRGDGLERARQYVADVFRDGGLPVTEQTYRYGRHEVANVIAATAEVAPDAPRYIVGAHYDTVPGTVGADDNASAVAVLLELGRRLAERPPALPLELAAFTLEEPPAFMTPWQGSRVYARRLKRAGGRVRAAAVLEMVGYTSPEQDYPLVLSLAGYPREGNYIGLVGNWRSRRFTRRLLAGFRRNPGLPAESLCVPFNGWVLPATRLSDHASFWDRGWPAVMVTDTAFFRNPNYHTPRDRPETLDFAFMAALVDSLELGLAELAG